MKMIVAVALALVACVAAAPPNLSKDAEAQVLRSAFDQGPEGTYTFGFDTDNGIKRNENGEVKAVVDEENKPHNVVIVRGTYEYTSPEGQPIIINYYADETGFHAEGDSIPKAPARR